jgi:hypothetical protein
MRAANFLFLVPLLACAAWAAQSPPSGFAEVPKEKLDHLKLVLTEANCSLSAPGAEWKWLAPVANPGKKYLCFNSRTGARFAVSIGSLDCGMTAHAREEILANLHKAVEASGAKIGNEKFEPATAPLPGKSWRLSYEETLKQGLKIGSIIYLVQTSETALITLQDSTATGAESPQFLQFVKSLALLK